MASIIPPAPLQPLPYGSFLLATSPTVLLQQELDDLLKDVLKAIKEKVIVGGGRMTQKTTMLQWPPVAGVKTVAAHYEVATKETLIYSPPAPTHEQTRDNPSILSPTSP